MSFFSPSRWGFFSKRSNKSERAIAGRNKTRVRPKHEDGRLAVLDVLETRELIGSFVADLAVTAQGFTAAERARDPLGQPHWLDLSVSDDSSDAERARAISGTGTLEARIFGAASENPPEQRSESTGLSSTVSWADHSSHTEYPGTAELNDTDSLPSALYGSTLVASTLPDVVPRSHGDTRNLSLTSTAAAGGGSGGPGFGTTTDDGALRHGSDIEIPAPSGQSSATSRTPEQPFVPPIPPAANGQNAPPSNESRAPSRADGAAGMESGDGPSSQSNGSENSPAGSGAGMEASAPGAVADNPQSPNAGVTPFAPPGQNCSVEGPPGQTGEAGGPPGLGSDPSTLNSQPSTPISPPSPPPGPPCTPPGQETSSSDDPLFVINWNDGLTMFPNVIEYDQPDQWQDLRAQVYGATVSSYSWDTSQASSATCITGSSSQRLQFKWNTVSGSAWVTNTVTVTATMSDQSTQAMTLTFKVAPGTAGIGCTPSSSTWPAVLTPDKPLEAQQLFASDSPTRPYAVPVLLAEIVSTLCQ